MPQPAERDNGVDQPEQGAPYLGDPDRQGSAESADISPDEVDGADQGSDAVSRGMQFDRWMAERPWRPRLIPYAVYVAFLSLTGLVLTHAPQAYVPAYVVQCALVGWLLWRNRRLTPELNLKFHWLAIPIGLGVAAAWIALGQAMANLDPSRFGQDAEPFMAESQMGPAVGWAAFSMRLLGMSILVPLFEELFIRSYLLRVFHRRRLVLLAVVQWLEELPVIGDRIIQTRLAREAASSGDVLTDAFESTPLGALSWTGVVLSTAVFMVFHLPRDWPAIWVCGPAYCLLLAATRRYGLGPVIWAHGLTNACLWGYTLATGDWRFL